MHVLGSHLCLQTLLSFLLGPHLLILEVGLNLGAKVSFESELPRTAPPTPEDFFLVNVLQLRLHPLGDRQRVASWRLNGLFIAANFNLGIFLLVRRLLLTLLPMTVN